MHSIPSVLSVHHLRRNSGSLTPSLRFGLLMPIYKSCDLMTIGMRDAGRRVFLLTASSKTLSGVIFVRIFVRNSSPPNWVMPTQFAESGDRLVALNCASSALPCLCTVNSLDSRLNLSETPPQPEDSIFSIFSVLRQSPHRARLVLPFPSSCCYGI